MLVHLDALTERLDVWRGEHANAIPAELQGCRCFDGERAFSVGACYVDGPKAVLRLAKLLSQSRHRFQTQLVADLGRCATSRPLVLEHVPLKNTLDRALIARFFLHF